MIPAFFHTVEVFGVALRAGASVGVAELDRDPGNGLRPTPDELAAHGLSAMVYVVPPRRDDCERRLRTFVAQRELPLSAKGSLAAAARLSVASRARFEQGVIATEVCRASDRNGAAQWTLPVDRPVINGRPIEDLALAASAMGLDAADLAHGLPVQSVSCGWLSVLFPLASEAALVRASLDLAQWQRTIEKAKPVYAVAFVPTREGPVPMRCLAAGAPEDQGTGVAGASVAAWLARFNVRAADKVHVELHQAHTRIAVDLDGPVARITGAARVAGQVTLDVR